METGSSNLNVIIDNLTERSKELNCLYAVDEILKDMERDIDQVMLEIVSQIPSGWRYCDICQAQITFRDKVYRKEEFRKTALKQTAKIMLEDLVVGEILVYYTKPFRSEKGIFLPEEQKLLNTITEKLSNYLLYRELRRTVKETNNQKPKSREDGLTNWLHEMNLSENEIELFTNVKVNFKKGETICKQGAITSYIILLADGLSKNYLEGNYERGFNFNIVKPFDFIGLSSLYNSNRYQFSGSTITPCTVYMIEKELFRDVINGNPQFAKHIMSWYCRITASHLRRLSCIANKQAMGRIAEILLYLTEEVFGEPIIPPSISRKDIAELAAMSTESAVRIMSELKNDRIISTDRNCVEVFQPELLKTLSMAG
ncbi:MAG: Crp/Fnr family transcriptional regulator [Bacteroidetes bacterium]|nr:Crp/Fnr family transcriptional regulator [Bacteroidota bacterium]MBU1720254.1 Crp/Fnr family transcriptional regulator [Bacteroidota bacterium]